VMLFTCSQTNQERNYRNMTMTEVNSTTINATTSNNATKNKIKITTSKEELIKEEEITLEDLAPDGGWGWMIALARILIMVSII